MEWWAILVAFGVPGSVFGLLIWFFKRKIDKNEKARAAQQKDLESLIFMMMQNTRANTILCVATAEAVRDGHCNGNMTNALKTVEAAAADEKKFLLERGIKYIFE
jgi:hypothetical protein